MAVPMPIEEFPLAAHEQENHPDHKISGEFHKVLNDIHQFIRMFRREEVAERVVAQEWIPVAEDELRWNFEGFDVFMKDGNRIDPGDFGQGERQLNWIWGGGRAWRPWRPTLEDLRTAGGRWHTLADRIEKIIDRSFGRRAETLHHLGMRVLGERTQTNLDGTGYTGQLEQCPGPTYNSIKPKKLQVQDATMLPTSQRPRGQAWELSIHGRNDGLTHWPSWPPRVGPIPLAPKPDSCGRGGEPYADEDPTRVQPWVPSVRSARPSGHGRFATQSGILYEGACEAESTRTLVYPNGDVYVGQVAAAVGSCAVASQNMSAESVDGWVRHGRGRFVEMATGEVLEGHWKHNEFQEHGNADHSERAIGRVTSEDGKVYYGELRYAGGSYAGLIKEGVGKQFSPASATIGQGLSNVVRCGQWHNGEFVQLTSSAAASEPVAEPNRYEHASMRFCRASAHKPPEGAALHAAQRAGASPSWPSADPPLWGAHVPPMPGAPWPAKSTSLGKETPSRAECERLGSSMLDSADETVLGGPASQGLVREISARRSDGCWNNFSPLTQDCAHCAQFSRGAQEKYASDGDETMEQIVHAAAVSYRLDNDDGDPPRAHRKEQGGHGKQTESAPFVSQDEDKCFEPKHEPSQFSETNSWEAFLENVSLQHMVSIGETVLSQAFVGDVDENQSASPQCIAAHNWPSTILAAQLEQTAAT